MHYNRLCSGQVTGTACPITTAAAAAAVLLEKPVSKRLSPIHKDILHQRIVVLVPALHIGIGQSTAHQHGLDTLNIPLQLLVLLSPSLGLLCAGHDVQRALETV